MRTFAKIALLCVCVCVCVQLQRKALVEEVPLDLREVGEVAVGVVGVVGVRWGEVVEGGWEGCSLAACLS